MKIITRLKICGTRPFFSVGPMELFDNIEKYHSIRKATEAMNMSYTKALRIISNAEKELGFPMVVSEKGGNTRGSTILTEKGKAVLASFREIQADVSDYAEKLFNERFNFS